MVLCGLGMQQCAMHNATIQKTTFFELSVYRQEGFFETAKNLHISLGMQLVHDLLINLHSSKYHLISRCCHGKNHDFWIFA